MKESDIQKEIIKNLTELAGPNDLFFFAPMNETAMMVFNTFQIDKKLSASMMNFFKKMGLVPGTPDLVICGKGRTIFVELKKPGEEPTDKQRTVHEKIRKSGNCVLVVNTWDELRLILEKTEIIKE